MLVVPSEIITSTIVSFLTLYGAKSQIKLKDGGLRVPNFKVMCKALLKLAWIGRFLSVQQPHEKENWKVIPKYFFGGLNNYDKRSPNSESIPVVVKEIFAFFF